METHLQFRDIRSTDSRQAFLLRGLLVAAGRADP